MEKRDGCGIKISIKNYLCNRAVEDMSLLRDKLHGDLARMGYTVRSEALPSYVLKEIERQVPDLIITDQNMPGMSGWEMIRLLKGDASVEFRYPTEAANVRKLRANKNLSCIKVIGYGDFPVEQNGFDPTGFDFIMKKRMVDFGGQEGNLDQLYVKVKELLEECE